jgi:hypothetical protein
MGMASATIERINWAIMALEKEEFTPGELFDVLKNRYPRWAPSMKALKYYLHWPQINAKPHNGRYWKINR